MYSYDVINEDSQILLKDVKVGYHVWYIENVLVYKVLIEDSMYLVVANLEENTNRTVHKNVGRSLHKIPNSNIISFISVENNSTIIKSLNPITEDIKIIKALPILITDICWLSENKILIPDDKIISQYYILDHSISVLHQFHENEIN